LVRNASGVTIGVGSKTAREFRHAGGPPHKWCHGSDAAAASGRICARRFHRAGPGSPHSCRGPPARQSAVAQERRVLSGTPIVAGTNAADSHRRAGRGRHECGRALPSCRSTPAPRVRTPSVTPEGLRRFGAEPILRDGRPSHKGGGLVGERR
jgi:hypothetical protein